MGFVGPSLGNRAKRHGSPGEEIGRLQRGTDRAVKSVMGPMGSVKSSSPAGGATGPAAGQRHAPWSIRRGSQGVARICLGAPSRHGPFGGIPRARIDSAVRRLNPTTRGVASLWLTS